MPLQERVSVLTIINAAMRPACRRERHFLESKTEWLAMEERRQTVSGRELQEILKDNRDVWKPTMKGIVEWIYEESEIMLHE